MNNYPILAAAITTLWGGFVACSSIGLAYISLWGHLYIPTGKVLAGSFFLFAVATLCIASILYMLKSVVREEELPNTTPPPLLKGVYKWLLTLLWISLLLTNVMVVKWFKVKPYFFTLGVLTYPFTFVFTDIISELYGKTQAQYAVWGGFIASGCMMGVVMLANVLPVYQDTPVSQQAFCQIFGFTPGMILASVVAYLIAQFTDIYLFDALRIHTKGKHLWLRNNVATMASQLLDTIVFSFFAWIIWPALDPSQGSAQVAFGHWYQLTLNEYGCKVVFALLDTPLVYGILKFIKKYK
jgi:uncharacterized integral membrane protein (TIGR00697 family)